MSHTFPSDLQQLIDAHLATGRYSSEEDVLRDALRALSEEEEDLMAVREAIDEWHAGDQGTPLAEAFDQVRDASSESETGE